MAAKMETSNVTEGWDKYVKFAVIFGTPVAVGLGYWLYRSRNNNRTAGQHVTSKDKAGKALASTSSKTPTPQTPLEKAQSAKLKGNKFFKGQKYEKAIECYTEAIENCPKENKNELSTFYQNRAAAHEQLKNYGAVVADCTEALVYNARYIKALNRRAKAMEQSGDLAQSLEDITAVCILEGFANQSSLITADRVLSELGKNCAAKEFQNREPDLPSSHFIRTYFSSFSQDPILNNLPDIIPDTEQPIAQNGHAVNHQQMNGDDVDNIPAQSTLNDPKDTPFLLIKKSLQCQLYDDIIRLCSEEIRRAGSNFLAESLLVRATFYLLTGEGVKANEDLSRMLTIELLNVKLRTNALIKRGSLNMQNENRDAALADFQEAIDKDPDNPDIYHHRGQLNLLLGLIEEAIKDFETCVRLNPDFAIAQVQKCYTEYRRAFITKSPMQLQSAMESFDVALKKFPTCADGYALYAQALSDQQLFDKADEVFIKSIELEPDNANIYVHRGLLYIQWKQDLTQGAAMINEAIKRDPKCEFAYETLGTFEVQKGNLKGARELFDKAINLSRTELEMAHLFSLKEAAVAQGQVSRNLGINLPNLTI